MLHYSMQLSPMPPRYASPAHSISICVCVCQGCPLPLPLHAASSKCNTGLSRTGHGEGGDAAGTNLLGGLSLWQGW